MDTYKPHRSAPYTTEIPGVRDFYSGEIGNVDVDLGIAETCKILCSKGFTTVASCEGHFKDGYWKSAHGYIWMEGRPDKPLPKGVRWCKKSPTVIRWVCRKKVNLEKVHAALLKWAEGI